MGNFPPEGDVPPPAPAGHPLPTAAPPVGNIGLGQGKLNESDERTMGLLAHLLGAFFYFVGPLIIWLIKKDESPFVNDQGKEALNFQITVAIAAAAFGVLHIILAILAGPLACVTLLILVALGVANLVFSILGGLEANKGKVYRYPFALRLIS